MASITNYTNLILFIRFTICFSKLSDNKVERIPDSKTDWTEAIPLTEYLNAFSNHKAIILIDNYKNVDIKTLQYPLLIRKYITAYWIGSRGSNNTIWVNPTGFRLNQTRILSPMMYNKRKCAVSKYFFKKDEPISINIYDLCVRYDGVSYSFNSKPLNFRVHISLFLPILPGQKLQNNSWEYSRRYFPSIFGFQSFKFNVLKHFQLPSRNPVLFISVNLENSRTNYFLYKHMAKALSDQMIDNFRISHGIIIASVVRKTVNNVRLRYNILQVAKHFFICAICHTQIIRLKNIAAFIKSAQQQKSGFPKVGNMIKLEADYEDFQTSPTSYAFTKHFYQCGNSIKLHRSRVSIDFQ